MAAPGYLTCSNMVHRSLEVTHVARSEALFQKREQLRRANAAQTHDSLPSQIPTSAQSGRLRPTDTHPAPADLQPLQAAALERARAAIVEEGPGAHEDEDLDVDTQGICPSDKPEAGNRVPRANFGRRWTHNEQICVGSCGVILGRVTFYGSESILGVRVSDPCYASCVRQLISTQEFILRLFPTTRSMPGVIWFDNNCTLWKHLSPLAKNNPFYADLLKHTALPVDVFHHRTKHSGGDLVCREHCDPAKFPELITPDGKWRFNSSQAEQTNVWLGGFQAILRDMQADRYTFTLDELIKRRNRMIVDQLARDGHNPLYANRQWLLGE
jgi:hypothetical protein